MNKKVSLTKRVKTLSIILILVTVTSFISFNIISTYRNYKFHSKKMRSQYIENQKLIIKRQVDHVVQRIHSEESKVEEVLEAEIVMRTNEAMSIAENIYRQNKNSKSEIDIKKMIVEALRPIYYANRTGFFKIEESDGRWLLFPRDRSLEGKKISLLKDDKINKLNQEMLSKAKIADEGFVEYSWEKNKNEGKLYRKKCYFKVFKPYNLIICTGLYFDDVENKIIKNLIENISETRFGKEGYIFINNWDGDALVSNGKIFDGTRKLWEVFDKNPKKIKELFEKEYVAALKIGGDYIYYSFPKLSDSTVEFPKASYIYGIPELKWLVGAGVYLDDIEKEIKLLQADMIRSVEYNILFLIIFVVILILIFQLFFKYQIKEIFKDYKLFITFFDEVVESNKSIDRSKIKFIELDKLAIKANDMLKDKVVLQNNLNYEKEQLYITLHSIGDGVIATDVDGRITMMNEVAEGLTGWKFKHAKNKPLDEIFKIFHAQTGVKVKNPVLKVLEEGKIVGLANHTKLISKNGIEYQISDSAAPIRDEKNIIIGVILVFSDVSKEYKMRDNLEEKEKRYHKLIQTSAEGFWQIDNKGKTIDVNNSLCNMLGYSRNEMLGKTPYEFTDKKNEVIFKNQIASSQKKKSRAYEICLRKKDGINFPTIFNATSFVEKGRDFRGSFAFITNISARKKVENDLKESELNLRSLFTAMSDIVLEISKDGEYLNIAPTSPKLLYKPSDELIGKKIKDIFPKAEADKFLTAINSSLDNDRVEMLKYSLVIDKKTIWFECNISPKTENSVLYIAHDITRRKIAEAQIEKDLEEKNILLRELYHRTKNNMQVISSMLRMQAVTVNNEFVHDVFKSVDDKIQAMSLVHKKLYQSNDLSEIDIKDYIEDLVVLLSKSFHLDTEQISYNLELSNVLILMDSAIPFGLVINEIISNMFKHAFPNGRKGEISIKLYKENNEIILLISDNGVGVPEGVNPLESKSMGLRTVSNIIKHQLKGQIDYYCDNGLSYKIKIKDNQHRKRI